MTKKILFMAVLPVLALAVLYAAVEKKIKSIPEPVKTDRPLPAAVDEYRRIMERFSGADSNIDLSGTIRIYDGENKYALKQERTFRYARYGAQFYAQLSRLRTFCDGSLILQLDTLNRMIIIRYAPHDRAVTANPGMAPFDRMFSDTASFRINGKVSELADERTLKIQNDYKPEIRSCSLIYDTLSYRLYRAEVEWWKQVTTGRNDSTRIWLAKLDYHYRAPVALDMHKNIDSVISIVDNRVFPRPAYKDYQINIRKN